jgi:hypothetical protein
MRVFNIEILSFFYKKKMNGSGILYHTVYYFAFISDEI